jgi:hypothetical protein
MNGTSRKDVETRGNKRIDERLLSEPDRNIVSAMDEGSSKLKTSKC